MTNTFYLSHNLNCKQLGPALFIVTFSSTAGMCWCYTSHCRSVFLSQLSAILITRRLLATLQLHAKCSHCRRLCQVKERPAVLCHGLYLARYVHFCH